PWRRAISCFAAGSRATPWTKRMRSLLPCTASTRRLPHQPRPTIPASTVMRVLPYESDEIDRLDEPSSQARWLEVEVAIARLSERFGETHGAAGQAPILFDRQQDMRWPAAICDKDRPPPRRLLGPADILVELPARQGGRHHFSLHRYNIATMRAVIVLPERGRSRPLICWERATPVALFVFVVTSHERLWRAALPAQSTVA